MTRWPCYVSASDADANANATHDDCRCLQSRHHQTPHRRHYSYRYSTLASHGGGDYRHLSEKRPWRRLASLGKLRVEAGDRRASNYVDCNHRSQLSSYLCERFPKRSYDAHRPSAIVCFDFVHFDVI